MAEDTEPKKPGSAWRVFWISLPFVVAIPALLAFGDTAGGWESIGYYMMAGIAGGIWSVALIGNLVYGVVRHGWRRSIVAALAAVPAVLFLAVMAFFIFIDS